MINPWRIGRVSGVPMYPPLGAWQSRRKLASAAWVPYQKYRMMLAGAHQFWYQFPELVLSASQTKLTRITVAEDFWLLCIMSRSTSALGGGSGTFRASFNEDDNAYKYAKYAVNQPNIAPNAQEPAFLRIPSFICAGTAVTAKVQNLDGANPNTVNICFYGVSAWWRT